MSPPRWALRAVAGTTAGSAPLPFEAAFQLPPHQRGASVRSTSTSDEPTVRTR
ncbi:hypothetical protein [Kineococcus aurantiacus]|uniref:Uncharacterized protein n=1 Tax=Kineococcus aurantiacus TaxID=37633 RepID=A0A7Y9J366_9ACTN|nr:hypothetical protein [Kineococcus aurantiacus]NYD24909.1 hypothetical protein [Kineococcus aurantiacus]